MTVASQSGSLPFVIYFPVPPKPELLLVFWLDRVAGLLPGIEPAEQSLDASESFLTQCPRHTGAGSFVRSGAVDDYLLVFRQLGEPGGQIIEGDMDGAFDPDGAADESSPRARIDDHHIFPAIHLALEFLD